MAPPPSIENGAQLAALHANVYNPNLSPFAGPGTTIVFQPGGTAENGIYVTWAAAWLAARGLIELHPTILVDSSIEPAVVPAGFYNFTNVTLGAVGGSATLTLASDVIVGGNELTVGDGLALVTSSTTVPPIALVATGFLLVLGRFGAAIGASGTQPFISVDSASPLAVNVDQNSAIVNSGNAAIAVAAGGSVTIDLHEHATIGANALTGAGTINVTLYSPGNNVNPTQAGATALTVINPVATLDDAGMVALALSAAGGAQGLPARPATPLAPSPSKFFATPSGNQAATTTYTLPVAGAYQPLDIVRVFFTHAQLAAANVQIVDGGAGTPQIAQILVASAPSFGWVDAKLNAAGAHWTAIAGGYN